MTFLEGRNVLCAGAVGLLLALGCTHAAEPRRLNSREPEQVVGRSSIERPPTANRSPRVIDHEGLTGDQIRTLVIEANRHIHQYPGKQFSGRGDDEMIGNCPSGSAAWKSANAADLHAFMAKYFMGPAVACYQESYFGCTIGEWIGQPVSSQPFPEFWADEKSEVIVLEKGQDRIVADVSEPATLTLEGDTPWRDPTRKSRYTFVRDAIRGWRIHDRLPNHEWSCPWQQ
jgi:hypothetical protein